MLPSDEALLQRLQDINRLVLWHKTLQHKTNAVQHSASWRIGQFIINTLLRLLGQRPSPSVWQSIEQLNKEFEHWQTDYWQQLSPREIALLNQADWHGVADYQRWLAQGITDPPDLAAMQTWQTQPRFSLLWVAKPIVELTWRSCLEQCYPHWKLYCCSTDAYFPSALTMDKRVNTVAVNAKATDAEKLNALLAEADGDYVLIMASHDALTVDALYQFATKLQAQPETVLIYSDHDYFDANHQRCAPYFKSDWNPDLFYNQNYLAPCISYHRKHVIKCGGFQGDVQQLEYDLTLRLLETIKAQQIQHVPKVLYHQARQPDSSLSPKTLQVSIPALQAHLARTQTNVTIANSDSTPPHLLYPLPNVPPLVSVIIPTRDRYELLQPLVDDLHHATDYPNLEIIIIDNGSQAKQTLAYLAQLGQEAHIRVIREESPFNYAQLNNLAVEHAQGEILALLNNDLRVIHPDWLTVMVRHALRSEVGAVGAKLFYPDDTVQHAGVVLGLGGVAGHIHQFLPKVVAGYYHKTQLVQNYSAVTAACMVLRQAVYQKVGGMDATNLAVAFNDVDLCLRIRQQGYRIVWTPHARLYHLESVSRGGDNNPQKYHRFQQELRYMQRRWHTHTTLDPFYNPNLSHQDTQCALAPWTNR